MPTYSHSRLSCFEDCKLKYKFAYIDHLEPELVSMDPDKRKEVRINKSTLWYQKKKIIEGKKIKIYGKVIGKIR